MRKLLFLLMSGSSILNYSQVGINTTQPEKTLDINGNFRLRTISDKSNDIQYNRILVADDSGDLATIPKDEVKMQIENAFMENKKVVVFSNTPDTDRIMQCGRFEFRFNTGPEPQMRLAIPPSANVSIYYSRIHKQNSGASSFYGDNTVATNISAEFDNSNNWVSLDNSGSINNTLDEIFISYPGDNNLYRVTLLPRTMQTTPSLLYFYTIMCEKF